jgi:hypothetical protein
MILAVIIFLLIYILLCDSKELFTSNNKLIDRFLIFIEDLKKDEERDFSFDVNIISSKNKKYLNLTLNNVIFSGLAPNNNNTFTIKKLNNKYNIIIKNKNGLYLSVDKNYNLNTSLYLKNENTFKIENIIKTSQQIDKNKIRFTCYLKFKNKYLTSDGLKNKGEYLFFDIKII